MEAVFLHQDDDSDPDCWYHLIMTPCTVARAGIIPQFEVEACCERLLEKCRDSHLEHISRCGFGEPETTTTWTSSVAKFRVQVNIRPPREFLWSVYVGKNRLNPSVVPIEKRFTTLKNLMIGETRDALEEDPIRHLTISLVLIDPCFNNAGIVHWPHSKLDQAIYLMPKHIHEVEDEDLCQSMRAVPTWWGRKSDFKASSETIVRSMRVLKLPGPINAWLAGFSATNLFTTHSHDVTWKEAGNAVYDRISQEVKHMMKKRQQTGLPEFELYHVYSVVKKKPQRSEHETAKKVVEKEVIPFATDLRMLVARNLEDVRKYVEEVFNTIKCCLCRCRADLLEFKSEEKFHTFLQFCFYFVFPVSDDLASRYRVV